MLVCFAESKLRHTPSAESRPLYCHQPIIVFYRNFTLNFVSESSFSVIFSFQLNLMFIISVVKDKRIFTVEYWSPPMVFSFWLFRMKGLLLVSCWHLNVVYWSLAEMGLFSTRVQSNSLPGCQISVNALQSVVGMCTTMFNTVNSAYFYLKYCDVWSGDGVRSLWSTNRTLMNNIDEFLGVNSSVCMKLQCLEHVCNYMYHVLRHKFTLHLVTIYSVYTKEWCGFKS